MLLQYYQLPVPHAITAQKSSTCSISWGLQLTMAGEVCMLESLSFCHHLLGLVSPVDSQSIQDYKRLCLVPSGLSRHYTDSPPFQACERVLWSPGVPTSCVRCLMATSSTSTPNTPDIVVGTYTANSTMAVTKHALQSSCH